MRRTRCRSALPPARVTRAAAAMPEPEPHSARQPQTSAAKVEWAEMKTPISPAASMARVMSVSDRPMASAAAMTAPGSPPQEPAVGAATMTPMALLTSIRAVT